MSPTSDPRPDSRQALADPGLAQAFRRGAVKSLPFLIVMIPFAILFGVVALEAGMDVAQVLGFSVLVLAGASQFTAVQLLSDNAPVIVVILSCLAVNLRMAMYSASLVPWLRDATPGQKAWVAYALVDQSYALSIQEYEANPRMALPQRLAFFGGVVMVVCLPWMIFSWVGATVGRAIPDDIALDFAMPITFLAMIAPMLRTPAHLAACFVAVLGSLVLAGLPSGLGLLIASPLGMAAGAAVEVWSGRRARA
ncbi:branched-chain amino acid ABC transporter permease [Paracoccus sp. YIM 132242]|uniref:Branched-chain amino acid ABC transporter permease n=1 Tax=Paracoccus lichenicola TaxID=2665644 RepID=A0A6L6HUP2_9RHOB|nr:AzlC family ABC transporter permease [Paracoccus lichenicola]MTE02002.1 branched-chain amino acid ABC transporter permease [Paracoccus lichenicola]